MENKFKPDYAIHVGVFLKDALEAYNMKQSELAKELGVPRSIINEIIKGKRNLPISMAIKLEPIFGMPASYWMNLQTQFDIAVAKTGTVIVQEDDTEVEIGDKSAIDIAHWFINRSKKEVYDGITHLKLQKLLYFAQAISLKLYNKTLFSDAILCWEYGPVVDTVYQAYKKYDRNPIIDAPQIKFDKQTEKILEQTYAKYGIYTASHLVSLTHKEKVWKDAEQNSVLSPLVIKQTYSE